MTLYQVAQFHQPFVELFMMMTGYYFLRTVLIAGGVALLMQICSSLVRRPVYRISIGDRQILSELKATTLVLLFDTCFTTVLIYFNLFKHTSNTAPIYALTFVVMFVWFEIWFYFTHRLLHHPKFYFIHAQHHTAKVTTPLTALSFSITERSILFFGGMGLPALLSPVIPMSFSGYAAYFTLSYVLNVYGHMNVEILPPSWIRNPFGSVLNSTTYHSLHHSRYQGHYGLFTPYLDEIFGSRFDDYELVHNEAYAGRGLEQLGKRLS